jgi:hypothetical protein
MLFGRKKGFSDQGFFHLRKRQLDKAFVFPSFPRDVSEFCALPEFIMNDPYGVAALTVVALAAYREDPQESLAMLSLLKKPQLLGANEAQLIAAKLEKGKDYKPYSYFMGAVPANDYEPDSPLKIVIEGNPEKDDDDDYLTLYVHSSGSASPRPILLKKRSDGTWGLWEQFLLGEIVAPKRGNPWA